MMVSVRTFLFLLADEVVVGGNEAGSLCIKIREAWQPHPLPTQACIFLWDPTYGSEGVLTQLAQTDKKT